MSKCVVCRDSRRSCMWGYTIPKQMNPIKIKIHEAKRRAGGNMTTTAEEKKGRNDGYENDDNSDVGEDGDDGTSHEQGNFEAASLPVSVKSTLVTDNEVALGITAQTLARTLWEIDQYYEQLVDSLVD